MKTAGHYSGGEIRDPNNPNAPSIFPCPICYHFFTSPSEMASHLESEHRKFQCDICKKLMSHKRNVDRHRKSVHENQRGFGCPMCPYRSAHKQVLTSKVRLINSSRLLDFHFTTISHILLFFSREKTFLAFHCAFLTCYTGQDKYLRWFSQFLLLYMV